MNDQPQRRRVNTVALRVGGHRFIFLYDDSPASLATLGIEVGNMAADPDLPLEWGHANSMMDAARRNARPAAATDPHCSGR